MTNRTTKPATRTWVCTGWMNRTTTVTTTGGTLTEARREAKRLALQAPNMLPGRVQAELLETSR